MFDGFDRPSDKFVSTLCSYDRNVVLGFALVKSLSVPSDD